MYGWLEHLDPIPCQNSDTSKIKYLGCPEADAHTKCVFVCACLTHTDSDVH